LVLLGRRSEALRAYRRVGSVFRFDGIANSTVVESSDSSGVVAHRLANRQRFATQSARVCDDDGLAARCFYPIPLEPSCVLVYGPRRYKFSDFFKVGTLSAMLIFIVVMLFVPMAWLLRER
jgi:hypothetical protein